MTVTAAATAPASSRTERHQHEVAARTEAVGTRTGRAAASSENRHHGRAGIAEEQASQEKIRRRRADRVIMKIKEIIIVEGRDDTAAVKKSVDAVTIETHGYGITSRTWELIGKAYAEKGIIIFTDPDHAGRQIRKKLTERFPDAGQAFLDRSDATRDGDIGIENASPESIRAALSKAHCTLETGCAGEELTAQDMIRYGLTGQADSALRRKVAGKALGIGYCNGRTFLQRLNKFGITKEKLEKALQEI